MVLSYIHTYILTYIHYINLHNPQLLIAADTKWQVRFDILGPQVSTEQVVSHIRTMDGVTFTKAQLRISKAKRIFLHCSSKEKAEAFVFKL